MTKGQVTMSIEDYNEMYEEIISYRKALSLHKSDWVNSSGEQDIYVKIKLEPFMKLVKQNLEENYPNSVMDKYYETKTLEVNIATIIDAE